MALGFQKTHVIPNVLCFLFVGQDVSSQQLLGHTGVFAAILPTVTDGRLSLWKWKPGVNPYFYRLSWFCCSTRKVIKTPRSQTVFLYCFLPSILRQGSPRRELNALACLPA